MNSDHPTFAEIGEKNIRYRKFHPLTYDDIKDDPYYYHSPEPEATK